MIFWMGFGLHAYYLEFIANLGEFSKKRAFKFYCSVVFFAFIIAGFEIAIEGKQGWAENAWNFGMVVDKGQERPGTYYHMFMNILYICILNFYFWKGEKWNGFIKLFQIELAVFSWMFMCWVIEDFFWFMLNPFYGISRFGPEYIWWHKTWFLGVPYHYWILFPLSVVFFIFSYHPTKPPTK